MNNRIVNTRAYNTWRISIVYLLSSYMFVYKYIIAGAVGTITDETKN